MLVSSASNSPSLQCIFGRSLHWPWNKSLLKRRPILILNVDGCIAVCFVDMLRGCGAFTTEEADDMIRNGCLNGLFVLGRSIGFIGHYLDQKRLKQGLYRHPWDDISYLDAEAG